METDELALTIAVYALLGGVYGVSGYVKNVVNGETAFDPYHFGSTVAIGAVAGIVVAIQGDDLEPGTLETAMVAVVPIADQLYNAVAK